MGIRTKQILAIIIGVSPLYVINIYANISDKLNYTPEIVLGKYLVFAVLVLGLILSLNWFLLQKTFKAFNQHKSTVLHDVAMAFLLLILYYFLLSLGQITYIRWLNESIDQTEVLELARNIFANWFYTFALLGPFVIITQSTWVISSAFVLNNLWDLTKNKTWHWVIIISLASIISLVNFHNGIQGVIFWFSINLTVNIFYYKYRRVTPLLIAFFIFQWFDFIGLWFYLEGN